MCCWSRRLWPRSRRETQLPTRETNSKQTVLSLFQHLHFQIFLRQKDTLMTQKGMWFVTGLPCLPTRCYGFFHSSPHHTYFLSRHTSTRSLSTTRSVKSSPDSLPLCQSVLVSMPDFPAQICWCWLSSSSPSLFSSQVTRAAFCLRPLLSFLPSDEQSWSFPTSECILLHLFPVNHKFPLVELIHLFLFTSAVFVLLRHRHVSMTLTVLCIGQELCRWSQQQQSELPLFIIIK